MLSLSTLTLQIVHSKLSPASLTAGSCLLFTFHSEIIDTNYAFGNKTSNDPSFSPDCLLLLLLAGPLSVTCVSSLQSPGQSEFI